MRFAMQAFFQYRGRARLADSSLCDYADELTEPCLRQFRCASNRLDLSGTADEQG